MTKTLTEGNPAKLILFFAIPLFIGNLFQQLYGLVDTFIVGQVLGVNALAEVGCTGSITFFILGFTGGMTSGLTVLTAQRFGAGDEEGVRRSFGASILISLAVTVIMTVFSVVFCREILLLLRTPPEILDGAQAYLTIICVGIGASVLFNLLSNMIRALGNSRTPLYFLVFACVVNIVLDYLLIAVIPLGVSGAAIATVVSQLLSGILCIVYIVRHMPLLHPHREDLAPRKRELLPHLRLSMPIAFQQSIIAIGSIIMQVQLNALGPQAVAAYTASQKIDSVAGMPLMSFGITMATYTAQNYGAKQYGRIRQGIFQCCAMSVGFSLVMAVVMVLFGRPLSEFFVAGDPAVAKMSADCLAVYGCCYWMLGLLFAIRYTLQGLGQTFMPTFAGVLELIVRVIAAPLLAGPFGYIGICWSNPLAWAGAVFPLCAALFLTLRHMHAGEALSSDQPAAPENAG